MKITRRKINSLVRQSLKENMEFQMRAHAKQELINRIMNLNSYQRLRAAEAELSMFPSHDRSRRRIICEWHTSTLKSTEVFFFDSADYQIRI